MKKLILLALVIFVAFAAYRRHYEHERMKIVGVWEIERNFHGGWVRLVLNLKEDGVATIDGYATVQARQDLKQASGTWIYGLSTILIKFDRGDVPPSILDKKYGGQFVKVEERSFTLKSSNDVETWTRVR